MEEESKHTAQMLPGVLAGAGGGEDGEREYPLADMYVLAAMLAWGRVGMRTVGALHAVMASVEEGQPDVEE